ncbi:MAG TPA: ABC transporter permease [Bryobacteraceae bacterium]|nr:ABC transporter permease [Bryobacteraceae bacterium]
MNLANDLRQAWRAIRHNPGFSAIAIATLAFGIGANTAIFSVVDGVLLRPLGYGGEGRLVAIHEVVPKFSQLAPRIPVNAMHFREWRNNVHAFESLALIGGIGLDFTQGGEPEHLAAARVSPSLFPMLGARTQLGRTFLEEEDQAGHDQVVVLSDGLWKRRFGSDPNVVGRKVVLDGHPYAIVGVLSASFHFPKLTHLFAMTVPEERPELWKPFAVKPDELDTMGDFNYACIGRLRAGISLTRALAELNAAQARIAGQMPEKVELSAALVPLRDQITGRSRTGLELVLSAAGFVLLIGCVNIANLLLARATSRKRELAIRAALGAGTRRLLSQILTESLLLASIGGALGAALAYGALRLILAGAPLDLPRLDEVHLNGRVLLFTVAVSILAGLFFGLLPAWRSGRIDPQEAMQSGARGTTEGRGAGRLRTILVGLEVALSTVCLIAGGLLLRSFVKLLEADKGFAVQQVVTVSLNLPETRYPDQAHKQQFTRSLLDSVRVLPGVLLAGISNKLPLSGEGGNNLVSVEGTTLPFTQRPLADIRGVNPDYFRTLNISLKQGRIFAEADRDRRVALLSAGAAEHLWPGQNPLGKRFKVGDPDGPFLDVAGVVGDVRSVALDKAPTMTVYVPYWQGRTWGGPSLAVRTANDPLSVSSAIRGVIRRLDSELPIPPFQTMEQIVDESVAQRRFQMNLIMLFAAAALVLAALGIYGVVSYSVALRTNEMGIRIALGARGPDILGIVVRQAMTPVSLGLAAGLAASLAAGRLLAGLLYGVAPTDPVSMAGVVLTLAVVAAVASAIPAWRATSIDPVTALRYD